MSGTDMLTWIDQRATGRRFNRWEHAFARFAVWCMNRGWR